MVASLEQTLRVTTQQRPKPAAQLPLSTPPSVFWHSSWKCVQVCNDLASKCCSMGIDRCVTTSHRRHAGAHVSVGGAAGALLELDQAFTDMEERRGRLLISVLFSISWEYIFLRYKQCRGSQILKKVFFMTLRNFAAILPKGYSISTCMDTACRYISIQGVPKISYLNIEKNLGSLCSPSSPPYFLSRSPVVSFSWYRN